MKKVLIQKNAYFDSVILMLTSKAVKQIDGVHDAVVAMGTDVNRELLEEMGFSLEDEGPVTPNDLVIAVDGVTEEVIGKAAQKTQDLLKKREHESGDEDEYRPVSLDTALRITPDANLAVISVPGMYAAREARLALEKGLHVMIFSDNVALEDEIALKQTALEKGLLVMGPDCGTAIINGKPLCFANIVRRGNIGIVAASGTGLQAVSCLIDDLGGGVSQAIGTGGRDLQARVGGLTTLMGIEALKNDPETRVITVISKPPAGAVTERILARLRETGKPCVVHFLGTEPGERAGGVHYAGNLEETAGMAVAVAMGVSYESRPFSIPEQEIKSIVARETGKMSGRQRYMRGLYTGGTLAYEAMILLEREGFRIHSNLQKKGAFGLEDPRVSIEHTIVDLGDDAFTRGRPHPMIDPAIREERTIKEGEDTETAVLLLDFVLGKGAHGDPAGAAVKSLKRAAHRARERGGHLTIIASVTGTTGDAQDLKAQRKKLESLGCLLFPSNYQASLAAGRIMKRIN